MIERIFISPARGAEQISVAQAEVRAGLGLLGDRNFGKSVHPGQNLTLVEAEEIEAFCQQHGRDVDLGMTRRNLITRGVRLNALVGKEFRVGELVLFGVELCEPCSIVGKLLASPELPPAKVVKHWLGRAGLRADVRVGGVLQLGAHIAPLS